jgi:phage shock protein A
MRKESQEEDAALRLIDRMNYVKERLARKRAGYEDAQAAANGWLDRLRELDAILEEKREAADEAAGRIMLAKAEQEVNKQFDKAFSSAGSISASNIARTVEREEAKALGGRIISGRDADMEVKWKMRQAENKKLLEEYVAKAKAKTE